MKIRQKGKFELLTLAAALSVAGWGEGAEPRQATAAVKHIIFFVGDGMQLEHEIAASRYLYGKDDGLSFHGLSVTGYVATWDVTTYNKYARSFGRSRYRAEGFNPLLGYDPTKGGTRPYPLQPTPSPEYFLTRFGSKIPATDSAAAATAWATGCKTEDGNIAWLPGDPADGALKTIAERLREEKGFAIGVATTVPFSHATPAAFVSHNVSRKDYHGIGHEIIRTFQPEVVIGGGFPGTLGTNGFRYLAAEDYRYLKADPASPYVFTERTALTDGSLKLLEAALKAGKGGKKLFGLFGGPKGNFESPMPHDLSGTPIVTRVTTENPLLSEATQAALKVLTQDPDGFFLMVEQGDIDWANHANDFQRLIGTIWDLHEAVRTAVDYVNRPGDALDWSNTVLIVTSDHSNSYMRLHGTLGAGDLPRQEGTCSFGGPACLYPFGEVSYGTTDHTNELVMLYGHGAFLASHLKRVEGSWYPGTRIIDNTQIYHLMASLSGMKTTPNLKPAVKESVHRRETEGKKSTALLPQEVSN